MKAIILLLLIFMIQAISVQECVYQRCPVQAKHCQDDPKCKNVLTSCQQACGLEIDQFCWTTCLLKGGSGASTQVAICAYNNCLQKSNSE